MNKKWILYLIIFVLSSFVVVATVPSTFNVHLQTTDISGNIVTGTFLLDFEMSYLGTCLTPFFTYSTVETTDVRGIINTEIPGINNDYFQNSSTVYLCYYRDTVLKSVESLKSVPYALHAETAFNQNLSGAITNSTNASASNPFVTANEALSISGSNANTNIDINNYNFSTTGNVNTSSFILNGTTINDWGEIGVLVDTHAGTVGPYLYNDTDHNYFNETKLNITISALDTNTVYTHLSNFTNDENYISNGTNANLNEITVSGNVTANNFFGTFTGNTSQWYTVGDKIYNANTDDVLIGTDIFTFDVSKKRLSIDSSDNVASALSMKGYNSSTTSATVIIKEGALPTYNNDGKGLQVKAYGDSFPRSIYYFDGSLGMGDGLAMPDTFLSRSTDNTFYITSNITGDDPANLNVTGNVSAVYYFGDGSYLTGMPTTSPAGNNYEVQFNNNSAFGASGDLYFNGSKFLSKKQTLIGGITEVQADDGGDLNDGLILHFDFNDDLATTNVIDSSDSATDGTLVGGVNTEDVSITGKINKAFDFDGTNYVDVNALDAYPSGKGVLSMSVWVNTTTAQNAKTIMGWWWGNNCNLRWELNKITWAVDGDADVEAKSLIDRNTGEWVHVVGTYDKDAGADNVKLYINGVNVHSATTTGTMTSVDKFNIGAINDGSNLYTGDMDDARVYSKALSQEDVTEIYNAGAGTESEGGYAGTPVDVNAVGSTSAIVTKHGLDSLNDWLIEGELEVKRPAYLFNLSVAGNVSASNFFGTFNGNSSIWSRSGTTITPTNSGDDLNVTGSLVHNGSVGLSGNYSVGFCWQSFSGGLLYATNCTVV